MKVESNSVVHFLYSFIFDPGTFENRIKAVDNDIKISRKSADNMWIPQKFPEDDVLSQVANFLNTPPNEHSTARLWKLNDKFDTEYGLGNRAKWFLTIKGKQEIEFQLGEVGKGKVSIQLVLFRSGVGFVTISAKPVSKDITTWLDFVHYFRYSKRSTIGIRAKRKIAKDMYEPFFPEKAGGISKHPNGEGVISNLIEAVLNSAKIGIEKTWWSEIFIPDQLIPYYNLFVDKIKTNEIPILLYQVRRIFHSRQKLHPTIHDLSLEHNDLLQYSKNQWFIFSLDGGGFVACNSPKDSFFKETLPQHLRSQYFLIYLFTLFQRFELMRISNWVSKHWLDKSDEHRLNNFKKIQESLLEFTARGYFSQIMQRENHHLCYQKWHDKFQLERLYEEVQGEVQVMNNHLQGVRSKRLEKQMNFLTILISFTTLLTSFLGLRIVGFNYPEGMSWWMPLIIVFFIALFIGFLLNWRLKR